jgi:hypothetical protein
MQSQRSGRTQQREESRENEKKNTHKILSKPLNWLQLTLNRREEGKMGENTPKSLASS